MLNVLIYVLCFLIAYVSIAIVTDLYIQIRHPDIFNKTMQKYSNPWNSELAFAMLWPIFWAGIILGHFIK